jgi:spore maturation protein CgeB
LKQRFTDVIKSADVVIVGSYVPDGVIVGEFVTETARGIKAFYDIDTPVTISKLLHRDYEYLNPKLIPAYDLYLSFAGGPVLELLENTFNSPMARPFYCSVDQNIYYPEKKEPLYDLGYMGTYSDDRMDSLDKMILQPAQRWREGKFIVAGPKYPNSIQWPSNVNRIEHIPPSGHRRFYCSQRFTLNITRGDMVQAGFAPSVRLFEAAACGTAIISDYWEGLNTFFTFGDEILLSATPEHTIRFLKEITEGERKRIGEKARSRVLASHTAAHRAEELEGYIKEALRKKRYNGVVNPDLCR